MPPSVSADGGFSLSCPAASLPRRADAATLVGIQTNHRRTSGRWSACPGIAPTCSRVPLRRRCLDLPGHVHALDHLPERGETLVVGVTEISSPSPGGAGFASTDSGGGGRVVL